MAPAKKTKTLKQKTKKKWYPIYAPAIFGGQLIGESHVDAAELLKGKFVNANLSTITNDMKKQNIELQLRIYKVVDGKGQTEIIGMNLVQGFVRRLVRRGRSKVDDSFTAKTKDGQLVRIKPLALTNTNCVSSTASQLRKEMKTALIERISKTGFVNVIQDILMFKIQKEIKDRLNKVYPIKSVDIRSFSRETVRGQVPEAELELLPEEEKPQEEAVPEAAATESDDDDFEEEDDDSKAADEEEQESPADDEEEKKE